MGPLVDRERRHACPRLLLEQGEHSGLVLVVRAEIVSSLNIAVLSVRQKFGVGDALLLTEMI
jgi:hypothetical protein